MKKCMIFLLNISLFVVAAPRHDELPWINAHDSEALKYAAPFLPHNPIILEAGVCGAEDTMEMKKRWPHSKIYGFEAHPKTFLYAQQRTKNLEGVTLHPYALFNYVGQITFYQSAQITAASSLLKDNLDNIEFPKDLTYNGNYKDTPVLVNCTTIDNWAQEAGVSKIDFIWLDTEGAELYILQHAKTILPTVRVISTEVNFKEFRQGMTFFDDLYDFLMQQGFVLKYIWGRSDWQGVAIFVKKDLL